MVLVNIDVTWVNVRGHLNKPFLSSKSSFSVLDGWIVMPRPPHSYENNTSPLHHGITACLVVDIHTSMRTCHDPPASLLLHYPTLLLSCFNAIRRQLHSAWAPGAPELCRHPVRHPQVPASPHRRPQQPSATIPVSCALRVLSVFPLLQTADERAAHAGDLQLISYQTIQIE